MLKFQTYEVVFQEIPDEITLAIDISNCPFRCKGCHSPFLWEDKGTPLSIDTLCDLIESNKGISCVMIAGGDRKPAEVRELLHIVKYKYPNLKTAWYSGAIDIPKNINLDYFDYIKVGPYIEALGGLKSPDTNQRLYKVEDGKLIDITSTFWK